MSAGARYAANRKKRPVSLCVAVMGRISEHVRPWLIEIDNFVNVRGQTSHSGCSLNRRPSAVFPARLASVMVSKKASEH